MQLPYRRPRLLEVHDQPWCPPWMRDHLTGMLTFLWNHRIPPFQPRAPYQHAAAALEELINEIESTPVRPPRDAEKGDEEEHEHGREREHEHERHRRGGLRVVDCCSGAGGPMPLIERQINAHRQAEHKPVIPVLMSDLHPNLPAWTKHATDSSSAALAFLPYAVDATHAPMEVRKGRHIRTFCLSFHHFDEDGARRVLEDAMRTADGVVIFEMQEPDIGSMFTILLLFPLSFLLTPFTRPSMRVLFFTYIIPLLPFILVLDGLVSAWRTRSLQHVRHLAYLACLALSLEGNDQDCGQWKWTQQRGVHTRPFGRMNIITGRRTTEMDEHDLDM